MPSSRTTLVGLSLLAHVGFAYGLGRLEAAPSRTATAIELASVKKAPKPRPREPEPVTRKPEPAARDRHAAASRAAAPAPAKAAEAAPTPAAVSDLPDFGLALSGGVDGTGLALPAAGAPRATSPTPSRVAPKRLVSALAQAEPAGCEDPPTKPKPRSVPQPIGTEAARAAGIEGKVRVELTVDESGHVVDVKLLQGLGYGLDEAALAAARRAEFEPALRCGRPTRATFNISMRFTL